MNGKSAKVEVGTKLVWRNGSGTAAKVVEIVKVSKDAKSFWVSRLPKGEDRFKSSFVYEWGEHAGEAEVSEHGAERWGDGSSSWHRSHVRVYPWAGETDESLAAKIAEVQQAAERERNAKEDARQRAYDEQLNASRAANIGRGLELTFDEMLTGKFLNARGEEVRVVVQTAEAKDCDWKTGEEYSAIEVRVTSIGGGMGSSWFAWGSEKVRTEAELLDLILYRVWY